MALTTPILLAKSSFAVYYVFGFATLLTVLVCIFAMPETRGKSLEAIDKAFAEHRSGLSLGGVRRRANTQSDGASELEALPHSMYPMS